MRASVYVDAFWYVCRVCHRSLSFSHVLFSTKNMMPATLLVALFAVVLDVEKKEYVALMSLYITLFIFSQCMTLKKPSRLHAYTHVCVYVYVYTHTHV